MALTIFFATAANRGESKLVLIRRFRLMRRKPRWAYHRFLGWLIQVITRSGITHVAVGDREQGVVLDPTIMGTIPWPYVAYVLRVPNLLCAYEVPSDKRPALDTYVTKKHRSIWPTIFRAISGGRLYADDCVCVTIKILRDAGVDVPDRIFTPRQLHEWISKQGWTHADLSRWTACDGQ